MKHWNLIFPKSILEIKYEDIIKNSENAIPNLIKKCDLDWHDDCLKFYKSKRTIRTTSDTQARKKLYKTSLNSWKNYEKYIKEFPI